EPESDILGFMEEQPIMIDARSLAFIENPNIEEEEIFEGSDETELEEDGTQEKSEEAHLNTIESPNPMTSITENSYSEDLGIESQEDRFDSLYPERASINILLGKSGSIDVVFEPNNTLKVSHPNMGIIGTMGTGKTQLARSIIAQFSKENRHNIDKYPIGFLVFDYKGDYRDQEFLTAVNGDAYRFNYPFNPLRLVVTESIEGMNYR
ncbi:MAG: DNA-binding protein, partial [Bacteroidales bacterium]|nr:DNA-binding protein [Bacteroidales bacterium]